MPFHHSKVLLMAFAILSKIQSANCDIGLFLSPSAIPTKNLEEQPSESVKTRTVSGPFLDFHAKKRVVAHNLFVRIALISPSLTLKT